MRCWTADTTGCTVMRRGAGKAGKQNQLPAAPRHPSTSTTELRMSLPAEPCPDDVPPEICEQAQTLIQIASLLVMEYPDDDSAHRGLVRELAFARRHRLSLAFMCQASGLDEESVRRLLQEPR